MWEVLKNNPKLKKSFDTSMVENNNIQKAKWFEKYPTMDLLRCNKAAAAQIVDVGGGYGPDLVAFRDAHSESHGRLVLQDLPETLAKIDGTLAGIECMGHNLFDSQPVKGMSNRDYVAKFSTCLNNSQVRRHTIFITFAITGLTISACKCCRI